MNAIKSKQKYNEFHNKSSFYKDNSPLYSKLWTFIIRKKQI